MRAGVAAGHPATAEAGAEILADGGTAADAAVAMCIASCVAETVMTGLLGGGHAIWHDGAHTALLDCFCDVPAEVGEMDDLPMPFGDEIVHYSVGPASCAVPGLPGGLEALYEAGGRLPWPRLVEPALRLAKAGVPFPGRHAFCLAMLEPAFVTSRGADLYAPGGRRLATGDLLVQPGLVETMECLAEEGPRSAYRGSLAEAVLAVDGVTLTWDDLRAYRARWDEPLPLDREGVRVLTRGGTGVRTALARLPHLGPLVETERVLSFVDALANAPLAPETHTTNLVAVDGRGRACVLTTSLGLGAGAWTPTFDLHLNSMLGEHDLVAEGLAPGGRMSSMMAPTLALDSDGLALAIGSAGGTRLRGALVQVAAGILDAGLAPEDAVARGRVHPDGSVVHAEPGVDERALERLEEQGREVRRWDALHHYFGGVSCVGRSGAAGDPRRDGLGVMIP
mgnify:FL=1